ncbi:heavy metal translocating P-type ATPase [Megalodesulfovibrio paquesii]
MRHPRLNTDFLEAHLASLPGVVCARVNTHAGSVVVEHDGLPGRKASIMAALAATPAEAFVPGVPRLREIGAVEIGLHLAAVVVSLALPPVAFVALTGLAVLTGLPVIISGLNNLFSRGFTASSLDAVSVGLCLAVRNYPAVCAIAFMRVLGDYIRQRNDRRSNALLHCLMRLQRRTVWVERDGVEVECPCEAVAVGEVVVCGPGELVAVDGEVLTGAALVNHSMITGESMPVDLGPGDRAISGAVVEHGRLRIRAEKVGQHTAMARINRFLENTLQTKALPEIKGEIAADRLAPATVALGAGAFAFTRDMACTASVASIDFVCSVKFPSRLAVRSSLCAAAKAGLLLKGGRALDALARVDAVVFDKTGTLTTRELRVTDILPLQNWSPEAVLTLAARLEQHYGHPVARGVLAEAHRAGLLLDPIGEVEYHVSHGVCGVVDGVRALIGSRRFLDQFPETIWSGNAHAEQLAAALRAQGKMALYVVQGTVIQGVLGLQEQVRPEARTALQGLRQLGVQKLVVLTGDHRRTAAQLLDQLPELDAIHWELKPEDKARIVGQLKRKGHCVAVVGDGVNDAPALASADLGICMPHGGDLAQASAQAIILQEDLRALCAGRYIALRQHRILQHCLWQGVAVNTSLLALAAAGVLSPLAATVLHNANTFSLMGYAMARAGGSHMSGRCTSSDDTPRALATR